MPPRKYKQSIKAVKGYSLSPANIVWIEASAPKGKQSEFVDEKLTAARLEDEERRTGEYGTEHEKGGG